MDGYTSNNNGYADIYNWLQNELGAKFLYIRMSIRVWGMKIGDEFGV